MSAGAKALRWLLVTPDMHRVHHSVEYDESSSNFGFSVVWWDRLFGTFQPEEERPTYGLTRNIGSFNPFVVALKTWNELLGHVKKAKSWRARAGYLFGAPGWSPDGSTLTTRQLREQSRARKPGPEMLNSVNISEKPLHGVVRTK